MKDMGDAYSRQLLAIETLTTGRSLLDVGCGVGVFLAIAKRRSWNAQGVDASEHAAYFASKHFGIKYSSSLVDFENSTFDVVRISHVLEHIPEPKPFLIRLQQLIKPGGILAVIVPNREPFCATIVNKIRRITSSKPRLAGAIYPDMHVLGFSPNSLTRLVIQAGFEPVTVFTVSMGNKVYFPMFYDGLLVCNKFKDLTLRSLVKYHLPMFIDNIGNLFGKGQWIVAHFRKKQS